MNTELKQRISGWLDENFDVIIEDLKQVVKIPSVAVYDDPDTPYGKECKKVLDAFLGIADGYGLATRNLENRCGEVGMTEGRSGINLWCHLDVVPVADGWTYTQPFEPKEVNGWLIGRGTGDNKGPAIGCMHIIRMFRELGIQLKHPLSVCVGCDEEHGMSDVMWYAKTQPEARLSIIADGGFPVGYGEKGIIDCDIVSNVPLTQITRMEAGLAHNIVPDKGVMTVNGKTIEGKGILRHSAYPWGGINAIHEMQKEALAVLTGGDKAVMEYFVRINDDFDGTEVGVNCSDELSGKTSCVGTVTSIDEKGRAVLHLNIRHCITAKSEELLKNIIASAEKNGCHVENEDLNGPAYFPRENPVVDALTAVFNEVTGENKEPYVMGGGTYARKLPNALVFGCGGLKEEGKEEMFAPGHGGAHQNDEGLNLKNYKLSLLILALGILEADSLID